MTSGNKRHLKNLAANPAWGLCKTNGVFAVRPLPGSHRSSISIPIYYVLRDHLKLGSSPREIRMILKSGNVLINNRVVTEYKQTAGLFDTITIKKMNKHYQLIFNIHKKFACVEINADRAQYRITRAMKKRIEGEVPVLSTLDGFNFKYADPSIEVGDTVKVSISGNDVVDSCKFEVGKIAYVYAGSNVGRVGMIKKISKHPYLGVKMTSVLLVDSNEKEFSVPFTSCMVIGESENLLVTLDEQKGVKLSEFELSNIKFAADEFDTETEGSN